MHAPAQYAACLACPRAWASRFSNSNSRRGRPEGSGGGGLGRGLGGGRWGCARVQVQEGGGSQRCTTRGRARRRELRRGEHTKTRRGGGYRRGGGGGCGSRGEGGERIRARRGVWMGGGGRAALPRRCPLAHSSPLPAAPALSYALTAASSCCSSTRASSESPRAKACWLSRCSRMRGWSLRMHACARVRAQRTSPVPPPHPTHLSRAAVE